MPTIETWRERVAEWRSSGQTAEAFSTGKGYAAGTLLWWSSRLSKAASSPESAGPGEGIRLARVVRRTKARAKGRESTPRLVRGEVVVELAGMRILVPTGADVATVGVVLDAAKRAARGEGFR
jgi:hypothetical protein